MLSLIKNILTSAQFQYLTFHTNPEVKGVQIQSVTLHVGLHSFHFNLISNMTTFRNEQKNDCLTPPTVGEGMCKDRIFAFMVLCAQFPLIGYAT